MPVEGMAGTALPSLLSLAVTQSAQIGDLYAITDRDRREAQLGTAAAVALVAATMPSEPGRTSYTFNLATFRGEQAAGASIAHRFNTDNPFAFTAGVSYAGRHNTAARIGVAGELERKGGGWGNSVPVRLVRGGRAICKKKTHAEQNAQ